MEVLSERRVAKRYGTVTDEKAGGAVYTPRALADFVSRQIVGARRGQTTARSLRILDPAVGHGELLVSLLEHLPRQRPAAIEVDGFETDPDALGEASDRLARRFPYADVSFRSDSFLDFVLDHFELGGNRSLFQPTVPDPYDIVIANPPYVRTQILGRKRARLLSTQFGLSGRVDLYHAFVLGISLVLRPYGVAGIILSNRFMTTKSGAALRRACFDRFKIRHAWDLGDTKLFDAAVLPAVLLLLGTDRQRSKPPGFTSIYQTSQAPTTSTPDAISALDSEGVVQIADGRRFHVRHGRLDTSGKPDGVWRLSNEAIDAWLTNVAAHTWGTFRDIGKIRVGVKTCADKIFIRNDWHSMSPSDLPELLRPLATHRVARRFKPLSLEQPTRILYPHEVVGGRRRAVELAHYPRSYAYLATHRHVLESRTYVLDAGRHWYEIWVPQDPNAWDQPKLVFRDIAEQPTFWIDHDGSVVNGDCYWLAADLSTDVDLLWLAAAVGNSRFIERFYDLRFPNKLYAGRRRFITQYVECFPLPDPRATLSTAIVALAKEMHQITPSPSTKSLQKQLDSMVWEALTGSHPDHR